MADTDAVPARTWDELVRQVGEPKDVLESLDELPLFFAACEGPDLIVVATNAASRAAYGKREPVGKPVADFAFTMVGQELLENYYRVFTEGKPFSAAAWRLNIDPSDPDSEIFINLAVNPWRYPDGRMRGIITWGFDVTQEILAQRTAEARAAGAEQRLAQAEQVVLDLQRNLLPGALPVLPQARLAAQYVVASTELQAGGDWFDAVPVGSGRVALVVGDVVGHGAAAAAAMAQLRTILHEALQSGQPLADAVDRLDRFAATAPSTRAATVCVAVLDPADGTLTWTARAHPPPLICAADQTVRYLRDGHGDPLGVGGSPTAPATTTLGPGEVLLLYTDGLIERPGETLDDGLVRLARVTAAAAGTHGRTVPTSLPDRLCSLTVERITRTSYADDVTVLAAHRLPACAPPLVLDGPARSDELAGLRDAVGSWLDALGGRREDHLALTLAAYEAAANVVDHAYHHQTRDGGQPGRLRLHATLDNDGRVTIQVGDDGRWRAPDGTGGGRGLALMRACTDDLRLDHRHTGTTVTLRRSIVHPTVIGQTHATRPEPGPAPHSFDVAITRRDPTVLSVRGPLDATTVHLLRTALTTHAAPGLVLDLTDVTFLASAGVQLLHEWVARDALRLVAPATSTAHQTLGLAALESLVAGPAAG
ncbi:SpoIIE family protein phosphatase [Actinoplanes sp. RD1]|uniref:SpoIIE family protein phosphatase n=1 Tax=Actinoplanes sp. RD1 TaxID=3064538 RepID=UPI002742375A|nr:SpoIIE family protein phosphatase [Actinoplanes sp. RD1]